MATTNKNPVGNPPLPSRRGLSEAEKRKINTISERNSQDNEFSVEMYRMMDPSVRPPKEMIIPPSFPLTLFLFMVIVDILDFIFGLFDWTGVAWALRALILNVIPMFIAFAWAGKTGKKYKEQMSGNINRMGKAASRLKGKGGGKIMGSKKLGKKVDRLIAKVLTKKARRRILGFLIAGIIPIMSLFALWSVFVYGFHKQRVKMAKQTNKSFEEMYRLQSQQEQD